MQGLRQRLRSHGFLTEAIDFLMALWRPETKNQHDLYVRDWKVFGNISPSIANAFNSLADLHI